MQIGKFRFSFYDFTHFLIPFLVLIIFGSYFASVPHVEGFMKISFLVVSAILWFAQIANEVHQYRNTDDVKKFKKNSRKDWLLFFVGYFLGSFIFGIFIGFFV